MREIKFRAWDGKRFLPWTALKEESLERVFDNEFLVVEQYTGLKDKNGREIYEGDIIIASWHFDKPHVVEWPDDVYPFREFAIEDELTIIGNIHENPELFK